MPRSSANRLLAALELLQGQRRVSGAALAAALAVDRRTVRRYISALEDMGIPIVAERGRDGGYALVQGYKLPPMMFSTDEAVALSLGLRAARQIGLGDIAPAAASAQAKLDRVMPEQPRQQAAAIQDAVALDLSRPASGDRPAFLAELAQAARLGQRVQLRYAAAARGPSTVRTLDPYGVAYRGGKWYVAGHCHLRRGLRSFRLDRIQRLAPLPERFARPAGFNVLDYLKQAIAELPRAHAIEVRLHCDEATARDTLFGEIALLESGKGWVTARVQADDLAWVARELARLPCRFQVVRPVALQEALRRLAGELRRAAAGRPLARPRDR
jgi:predicted DNA-binding transcriptional regulator YafY